MNSSYDVIEHSWDTAPADLWPLIQAWIMRQRAIYSLKAV